jgi:hypothetical protein
MQKWVLFLLIYNMCKYINWGLQMRNISVLVLLTVFTFFSFAVSSFANQPGGKDEHNMSPVTGSKELEKLKTLAGTWQGTTVMDGKEMPVTVTYKTSSNGSVVVETLFPDTPHEMVSVYYDVNGKLGMTHYCAMDNQPHLTLEDSTDNEIDLVFANGTNLDPKKDHYMHDVSFEFKDGNSFVQEWTSYENGKEDEVATFTFTRAK